ncbi:hypothetical protein JL811_17855 [Tabrizicola sp. DMG-N-6]|uniref:Uncharacterized protein n=1 Tax=Szabonella alba TaxID=2804194 RepID=A0A8K0VCC0_9RHOB|nr:hypothetical protein [Szabonella alba]
MLFPVLVTLSFAGAAQAECFADYKAKQDNPLRLHYGVMDVSDAACSVQAAPRVIAPRLSAAGWTLLNVISVFGPEGLEERKAGAGEFFRRF